MKKTYKRIIAREFLFLLGSAILLFITVFSFALVEERYSDKQHELEEVITQKTQHGLSIV